MKKYNISDQFKPFKYFTPPINKFVLSVMRKFKHPPKTFFNDQQLNITQKKIKGYKNDLIDIYIASPKSVTGISPCLVYFHGGGFVMEGGKYHFDLCRMYAKALNCKLVYVKYRLAPKYPFPYFTEDCYQTYKWVIDNASRLNIDPHNVGVGGDSAGGNLAAGVCIMAKERNIQLPKFQLLVYPFLDGSLQSDSNKKYTDTPIWNSNLSKKIQSYLMPKGKIQNIHHISPFMAPSLKGLPTAYIETAEYDCLHDDGITYAQHLTLEGVKVTLNQTKQTMHGFDMVLEAEITKQAIKKRICFMKKMFEQKSYIHIVK